MNRTILMVCILAGMSLNVYSQKEKECSLEEKKVLLDKHEKAFISMGEKIRDPYITTGKDGRYYLTGTTAGTSWGDTVGVKVWCSDDLCRWTDMGFVWKLMDDGKNGWFFNRPPKDSKKVKNPYAVWAPELHYMKNTWWITVSRNGGGNGLLKSVSGKIQGPYKETDVHYDKGIDSHLFEDGGNVYYAYGFNKLAKMDDNMESIPDNAFTTLELPGKHPMGYEGILMMKYKDKYLWIASGRYGYEPTNTYDLYYAVSDSLDRGYSSRRMMIKNAGHGNIVQDKNGKWWCTAFDHEYSDKWCCWLVPIDIRVENDDVIVDVLDERFKPTEEDQEVVRELSKNGVPEQWKGKAHWWRPE